MAGFESQYPYSDFHELNADFLLKRMHELELSMQNLDAHIQEVATATIQPYINQLNSLMAEYSALDARVTQTLTTVNANIAAQNAHINNEFARINAYNNAQLETMRQNLALDLARGLEDIDRKFIAWNAQANNKLADMQRYLNTEIAYLNTRMDLFESEFRLTLEQFLEDLPESFVVTSPFTGEIVSVQEAINELYENASRNRAITAGAFDSLGITAQEFDDLEMTAWEFDMFGLDHLPVRDPLHNMYSPFTGEWSPLPTVITQIVDYQDKNMALTADEYDDLEMTAQEFDTSDISAIEFDFFGKQILAA